MTTPLLRFGPFAFDSATGELSRNNHRMALRPQAAQVLSFLAGRAGQLVTRDELNRELWSAETYVDFEHGLNLCIHEIRTALHDDSSSPTYVETLPRRGYRFIAAVEWDEVVSPQTPGQPAETAVVATDEAAAEPPPQPRRIAAILSFAAVAATILIISSNSTTRETIASPGPEPQPASLALLTLKDLGSSSGEEYFANGISWELQRQLEGVNALRVAARRSMVAYDETKKTAPVIGRELNVSNLLSGSLLRTGGRIRLNLKLVQASSGATLWAGSYDTTLADLLQTEAQAARAITNTIGHYAEEPPVKGATTPGQVNAEAHAALLKAMGSAAASPEEFERGLERALAIDPDFELAWSLYAVSRLSDTWFAQTNSPMTDYPKAKERALKALSLDDSDSSAHTTLAAVKLHNEWDWAGAEREFRRAIQLSPSNAHAHHIYSHYLLTMDRLSESVAESRIASELSPLDPNLSTCVGWHCLYARQYDDAIAACMKLIRDEQAGAVTWYYLGRVYLRQGKISDGVAALEIAEKKSGGFNAVLATLAYAYGRAGRRADAERVLAVLMDRAQRRYVSAFDIAVVYAGLGETDKTFEWLDRAFLERSTWLVHLKWDDRFISIRSDPRMVILLRRMGIPNPESVRQPETTVAARYVSTPPSSR